MKQGLYWREPSEQTLKGFSLVICFQNCKKNRALSPGSSPIDPHRSQVFPRLGLFFLPKNKLLYGIVAGVWGLVPNKEYADYASERLISYHNCGKPNKHKGSEAQ